MSKRSFVKGLVAGAAVGAVAGVVTGLLTAPKSGKELRKDLVDYAKKMRKDVDVALGKAQKVTKETYEKVVSEVTQAYSKVKEFDKEDLAALKNKLLSEWESVSKKFSKAVKTAKK